MLIADADVLTHAGVRAAVESDGFEVCAEAGDLAEALESALVQRPDLCVIDVDLPGGGIAAAGQITSAVSGTAVVMLTLSRHDGDVFAALRAGASGYLHKDADTSRLPHALRGVLSGEAALPRAVTARLIEEFRRLGGRRLQVPGGAPVELTARELEVLDLLREGLSTAQAAERLAISQVTVRRHLSGVVRKLGVRDRAAALRLLDG